MKIITSETCPSCVALKAYLKGNLSEVDYNKIDFIDVEDFGYGTLRELGAYKIPTAIANSGEVHSFSELLKMSEFIKGKLKESE